MDTAIEQRLRYHEPMLTAADIAVRYRLVADGLIKQGRVFHYVTPSGLRLYPECQFDAEGPREAVAMIIEVLATQLRSIDELCEWFYVGHGSLDGACAADVLVEAPHRAVALALDPVTANSDELPAPAAEAGSTGLAVPAGQDAKQTVAEHS